MDYKPTLHPEYLSSEVKDKLELVQKNSHSHTDDLNSHSSADSENDEGEPPQKRAKLKGRNKHRPKNQRIQDKDRICPAVKENRECRFGDKCKFSHDKEDFISKKLPELEGPCYIFDTFGHCHHGIACRYAKNHLTDDLQNIRNEDLFNRMKDFKILNELSYDVRNKLWKRKYNFKRADQMVKNVQKSYRGGNDNIVEKNAECKVDVSNENSAECVVTHSSLQADNKDTSDSNIVSVAHESKVLGNSADSFAPSNLSETAKEMKLPTATAADETDNRLRAFGCVTDEEIVRVRPAEVKKVKCRFYFFINFLNSLALALHEFPKILLFY